MAISCQRNWQRELTNGGKLTVLAWEMALNALIVEQRFQMSGLVNDESAVRTGRFFWDMPIGETSGLL
ncbi:MAG: hypothetical protein LBH75_02060 [Treponema sp.]|nr:hypothetical protein [Treponema sp.]